MYKIPVKKTPDLMFEKIEESFDLISLFYFFMALWSKFINWACKKGQINKSAGLIF